MKTMSNYLCQQKGIENKHFKLVNLKASPAAFSFSLMINNLL
jgi:hypothetical protein